MKEIFVKRGESVKKALDGASRGDRIILAEGDFREKLEITVPDIEIIGAGAEKTRVIYDDYAKKVDENGLEYVTFRTYTVAVTANGVKTRDITIENDALCPEAKGQEVALTVYADGFFAENCRFISTQDTVFCGPLPKDLIERYDGFLKDALRADVSCRQVFRNCLIAGNVDFIFGCGDALFDNCEIMSVNDVRGHGYAAAPAHSPRQETGFVFSDCRFTAENSVAGGSVYLARPWRDYGKCSFINCVYGEHISAEGFDKWNDTERDKTARFFEYPEKPAGRVSWSKTLTEEEKEKLLAYFS